MILVKNNIYFQVFSGDFNDLPTAADYQKLEGPGVVPRGVPIFGKKL